MLIRSNRGNKWSYSIAMYQITRGYVVIYTLPWSTPELVFTYNAVSYEKHISCCLPDHSLSDLVTYFFREGHELAAESHLECELPGDDDLHRSGLEFFMIKHLRVVSVYHQSSSITV